MKIGLLLCSSENLQALTLLPFFSSDFNIPIIHRLKGKVQEDLFREFFDFSENFFYKFMKNISDSLVYFIECHPVTNWHYPSTHPSMKSPICRLVITSYNYRIFFQPFIQISTKNFALFCPFNFHQANVTLDVTKLNRVDKFLICFYSSEMKTVSTLVY